MFGENRFYEKDNGVTIKTLAFERNVGRALYKNHKKQEDKNGNFPFTSSS
jgi:hypothetical protein